MTQLTHFTALIDALELSSHLLTQALDIVTKDKGGGTSEERRAEWLPLFFSPVGDRLVPLWSNSNETPETLLEHNVANTPREQWEILRQRATIVQPAILRGRYLDFLWRTRQQHRHPRPHEFALNAVTAYQTAVGERLRRGDLFWDALSSAHMIGRIGRELNQIDLVLCSMQLVGELVDSVEDGWHRAPGWPLRAGRLIADLIGSIPRSKRIESLLREAELMLGRLLRFMPAGHELRNSPIGRDVLDLRSRLEDLLGQDSLAVRKLEIAESLFAEAEQRACPGNFTVAGALMMDAVEHFSVLGMPERASTAKRLARNYFNTSHAEMHTYEATTAVDAEPLDFWMSELLKENNLGILLASAAAANSSLIPNWNAIVSRSNVQNEEFKFQAMLPTITIVDGRPVSRDPDGVDRSIWHNWTMQMSLDLNLKWTPLLEELIRTERLTGGAIFDELQKAEIIPTHNSKAFRHALEAAVTGNHLTACHMLPSLIESALRTVLSARNIDTTAFRPHEGGVLQERMMGAFFCDETRHESPARETIAVLGEDLWQWYRMVLFEETGWNLRNRSAHGLLSDDECTPQNTNLLLLGIVSLMRIPQHSIP